jgi:hypothetical protein
MTLPRNRFFILKLFFFIGLKLSIRPLRAMERFWASMQAIEAYVKCGLIPTIKVSRALLEVVHIAMRLKVIQTPHLLTITCNPRPTLPLQRCRQTGRLISLTLDFEV